MTASLADGCTVSAASCRALIAAHVADDWEELEEYPEEHMAETTSVWELASMLAFRWLMNKQEVVEGRVPAALQDTEAKVCRACLGEA